MEPSQNKSGDSREQMREVFEKWFPEKDILDRKNNTEYVFASANLSWESWRAATARAYEKAAQACDEWGEIQVAESIRRLAATEEAKPHE